MVSTRFDTLAMFTQAAAPAEVLKTVGLTVALRLFGMITPSAPDASAVRIIAPRLCGSCISSHIIMNGGLPLLSALASISSTVQYVTAERQAATPPCLSPHIALSLSSPTSLITIPCFFARAIILFMPCEFFSRYTVSTDLSALSASVTAFLPYIISSFEVDSIVLPLVSAYRYAD